MVVLLLRVGVMSRGCFPVFSFSPLFRELMSSRSPEEMAAVLNALGKRTDFK